MANKKPAQCTGRGNSSAVGFLLARRPKAGTPSGNPGQDDQYMKDVGSTFPINAKFAALEGRPAVYTERPCEGWWLDFRGTWQEAWADVVCKARCLSKAEFNDWFGELPPLPAEAFS